MALNDIKILKSISSIDLKSLSGEMETLSEILNYTPINNKKDEFWEHMYSAVSDNEILDVFVRFYNTLGCGDISRFRSFKYDGGLKKIVGIDNPDPITFDDIIGYTAQTDELIDNTEAFIKGFPANNVLLVGSRGTGKSSSVKALANKYYKDGLRIIEITKDQIVELTKLLSSLKDRGRKFIILGVVL